MLQVHYFLNDLVLSCDSKSYIVDNVDYMIAFIQQRLYLTVDAIHIARMLFCELRNM
jgi:hypothetical protein